MGNPLSILLATSLCITSVYSWEGKCVPAEEKFTREDERYCRNYNNYPVECDEDHGCRWSIPAEVESAKEQERASETAKTHEKPPQSLSSAGREGDRFKKDLPPIDAVMEKIGDYVVYQVLMHHMPHEYRDTLSTMINEEVLQITTSPYKVLQEVLPDYYVKKKTVFLMTATDTERKSDKNPIQHVLRYSRPYLDDVESFAQSKITMKTFTLNSVVSNAITAWLHNYIMNSDLYIGFASDVINAGNMMLYDLDDKWVYIPIDPGFARYLTVFWFKTLHLDDGNFDVVYKAKKNFGVEKDYKQMLFSDTWLSGNKDERVSAGEKWNRAYIKWLKEDTSAKSKQFVEDNLLLFPAEVAEDENLIAKVSEIVDVVWTAIGQDLCLDLHSTIEAMFEKIHPKKGWFTKKKKRTEKSEVLSLLPKRKPKKERKTKADEEDARNIFETQWNFVVKAMGTQAKQCADWSKAMGEREEWRIKKSGAEKQWIAITEQLPDRPLLKDYISAGKFESTKSDEELTDLLKQRRDTRAKTIARIESAGSISFEGSLFEEKPAAEGVIRPKHKAPAKAHTVPYGDGFHLNMYSNDDPRMKPPYPSSHSDHDVKQPRYLWMFLMATVIVCGCFAIYSLWCIVNSLLCGILCYAKLLSSSPLWPWSTEQRVVCADEDFTSAV